MGIMGIMGEPRNCLGCASHFKEMRPTYGFVSRVTRFRNALGARDAAIPMLNHRVDWAIYTRRPVAAAFCGHAPAPSALT